MIKGLSYYLLVCVFFCGTFCSNSKQSDSCEITSVSDENKKNDTRMVLFQSRVAFDTTANLIRALVLDRKSNKPIKDCKILLIQGKRQFQSKTDSLGHFEIFKNDFDGEWEINLFHPRYRCLRLKHLLIGGGLELIIKLNNFKATI